jgi:hypothetical protein
MYSFFGVSRSEITRRLRRALQAVALSALTLSTPSLAQDEQSDSPGPTAAVTSSDALNPLSVYGGLTLFGSVAQTFGNSITTNAAGVETSRSNSASTSYGFLAQYALNSRWTAGLDFGWGVSRSTSTNLKTAAETVTNISRAANPTAILAYRLVGANDSFYGTLPLIVDLRGTVTPNLFGTTSSNIGTTNYNNMPPSNASASVNVGHTFGNLTAQGVAALTCATSGTSIVSTTKAPGCRPSLDSSLNWQIGSVALAAGINDSLPRTIGMKSTAAANSNWVIDQSNVVAPYLKVSAKVWDNALASLCVSHATATTGHLYPNRTLNSKVSSNSTTFTGQVQLTF